MKNRQVVSNKQFIGLVIIFLCFAGILFFFKLISTFVLLTLFWLFGGIIVFTFVLKVIDGITDMMVIVKTKFVEAKKNDKQE